MKSALSEKLRSLRVDCELTQKELAIKLNSTDKNIWAYENGVAMPPLEILIAYAKVFECSADYLLGLETEWGTKQFSSSVPTYTKAEQEMLADFRQLSPNCQKLVRETITNFLSVAARGRNKNIS